MKDRERVFCMSAGRPTTSSVRDRLLISCNQSAEPAAAAAAAVVTVLCAKDAADKSTRRRLASCRCADDTAMNSFGLTTLIQFLGDWRAKTTSTVAACGRSRGRGRALITPGRDRVSPGDDPVRLGVSCEIDVTG